MIAPLVRFIGNRQPPVSGQILTDGVPVDITGSTVTFYMKLVGAAAGVFKVNGGAVVVDSNPLGQIHYNFAAIDVDTAGYYVGWWRVTLAGGQFEETPEFLIQFLDHVPVGAEYVSVEELKTSRAIQKNFADDDVRMAVQVASRFIDGYCNRTFAPAGASETRYFTPVATGWLTIDDAVTISAVTSGGTPLVQGTDFVVEQYNYLSTITALPITAAVVPFVRLRSLTSPGTVDNQQVGLAFPRGTVNGIAVTGTFGWPAVPPEVKAATKILAGRLVQLIREGSMVGLGFDGSAIPLGLVDGAVAALLQPYEKTTLVA